MYVTYKSDAVVFSFPSALFDGIFLYVDIVKSQKREGGQKKASHGTYMFTGALCSAKSNAENVLLSTNDEWNNLYIQYHASV